MADGFWLEASVPGQVNLSLGLFDIFFIAAGFSPASDPRETAKRNL